MKKIILLLAICVITTLATLKAQTVYYKYDGDGNRSSRSIYLANLTKSAKVADSVNVAETDSVGGNNKKAQPEKFQDKVDNRNITIYPNPTRGMLYIKIDGGAGDVPVYSFEIYDLNGHRLQNVKGTGYSGEIDLSSYKAGMYIMNINIGGETSQWNIIKE